ncbi:brassinosteroid-related acyltransferase 1 isoform X2 [Ziziphus jujuba]|uniref:Brassinosteroid-related acyltransferase 1 isoform X2 n=1 Tax=Ziziphus jujuba TaxID=326968 RepID=A0A6P3ZXD3_ZIZJJ|nr:brassinosteroid-related acyltransferase 1 isoform X2 [Ziziphus jujuba]
MNRRQVVSQYHYLPHSASQIIYYIHRLKSGLEEALSIWYPAAGRLSLNPSDGKLNLWCNNKGAVLVEAMSPVKISDLGDLSQYNELLEKLVFKPDFGGNFSDMPLVVGQVTKFGCGGYSIGIGTSHSLFDGPAAYDFLSAWASASAVLKPNKTTTATATSSLPELYKPVHERPLLLLGNSQFRSPPKAVANNLSKTITTSSGAAAIDHLYHLIMQAAAEGSLLLTHSTPGSSSSTHNNYVLKTFHLSGNLIENLKMQVFNQNDGFSSSSFEVVAAHLWKARSKALGLKKETMACLQFAVDTRNKVVPPLPNSFSGNAYVLASVALKAGELELVSHKTIIQKIREAKNSVNNDYVKAYMEGLQGPQGGSLPPLKELTIVSDWTRMPFHKVEFLHGHAAAYASPLLTPIPQVAYFIQNPNDNKGIHVRIGLLQQYVDAFSRYFLTAGR